MGHVGKKKKSLIFYLSKSSHIAAQKKIERKLTFLRNTTNVNRYQLLTTLAYVLDSSASTQTSVMVFSEHSKIQLSQLNAYKYTKNKISSTRKHLIVHTSISTTSCCSSTESFLAPQKNTTGNINTQA